MNYWFDMNLGGGVFVQPINGIVVAPCSKKKKNCLGYVQRRRSCFNIGLWPWKYLTIWFLFIGFAPKDLLHF